MNPTQYWRYQIVLGNSQFFIYRNSTCCVLWNPLTNWSLCCFKKKFYLVSAWNVGLRVRTHRSARRKTTCDCFEQPIYYIERLFNSSVLQSSQSDYYCLRFHVMRLRMNRKHLSTTKYPKKHATFYPKHNTLFWESWFSVFQLPQMICISMPYIHTPTCLPIIDGIIEIPPLRLKLYFHILLLINSKALYHNE